MFLKILFLVLLSGVFFHPYAHAEKALALIKGTEEGSTVDGIVQLEVNDETLDVSANFKGVPPGKHGFHIHEKGDCSDQGKAAGGHYNPRSVDHGFYPKDGMEHSHLGDMGNVEIAEDGTGTIEIALTDVHLSGDKNNVSGLSVILHEKEDDFGQPTGNAGGRIGCGIIEPVMNVSTENP